MQSIKPIFKQRAAQFKLLALRLLRRIPMPLLSILIGLTAGVSVWGFMDNIQSQAVRKLFHEELKTQLDQRSRESLIRFDQYLSNYAATTRLLANHRRLAQYLEPLFWFPDEEVEPVRYRGFRPYWLPDFLGRKDLLPPSHVLLVDLKGRIKEIYRTGDDELPKELSSPISDRFLDASEVRAVLTRFGEKPYLLVSDAAEDASGYSMGFLLVVVPVGDRLLAASQKGVPLRGAVVAVLDADDQHILASSDPHRLFPGTPVEQWRGDYQVTSQSFSQYEGADWNLLFATFMPHDSVKAMSKRVRRLQRHQRILAGVLYIGVFTLVIYLVSNRLNRVLKRIARFSQRALGKGSPDPGEGGNQLLLLEDRVQQFTQLVMAAREEMRHRHESEMRETEALKTSILEASLDSIVTIDGDGRIIEFNPTAERAFGYPRAAVIGEHFAALFPVETGRDRFQSLLNACQAQQPRDREPFVRGELDARRADGSEVPVEISIVPILLDRKPVYTLYLHDISKRIQAEREIKSLAKFARESPIPVSRVDKRGVILYANEASEPLLRYWDCRRGQTLPLYWRRLVAQVFDEGHNAERELSCDGRVFSLVLAPISDLNYVNIYGRDITLERQAEQEARQHQAELVHVCRLSTMGEMATGMAHELNQPLSAIVNFANGCNRRLQSGIGDSTDLIGAMHQITQQAERAGEIIRRLRGMVGKQPPSRDFADLNHLVREVWSFVEFEARKLQVDVRLEYASAALPVRADLVQIEQVLLNLVRNALDALQEMPADQRRLLIRTSGLADRVRVEIRDSGPGMEQRTLTHLFDPFYTTKATGMGMGLPISKTIVDDHGGKIWARSKPGAGAIFYVLLPAVHVSARQQRVGIVS